MPHIRKPHKKSKNGCADCKRRRVKVRSTPYLMQKGTNTNHLQCDETRPSCLRCVKRGITCNYNHPPTRAPYPEYQPRHYHLPLDRPGANTLQVPTFLQGNQYPTQHFQHQHQHQQHQHQPQAQPQPQLVSRAQNTFHSPHYQQAPGVYDAMRHNQLPQSFPHMQVQQGPAVASLPQGLPHGFPQGVPQGIPHVPLVPSLVPGKPGVPVLPPIQAPTGSLPMGSNSSSDSSSRRFSLPPIAAVRNKSLCSTGSSNSSAASPDEPITSPEDSSSKSYPQYYTSSYKGSLALAQNVHERCPVLKCAQDYQNGSYPGEDSKASATPPHTLPLLPTFTTGSSTHAGEVFPRVKIARDAIQQASRVSQPKVNVKDHHIEGCDPMFVSSNINYPEVESLNLDGPMKSYAFMHEIFTKLSFQVLNKLPFALSNCEVIQNLILECLQHSSIYPSLIHSANAVALLTLYHENSSKGADDLLNYKPDVYLSMASYHFARSVKTFSTEMDMMENSSRAVCLKLTAFLQTLYTILSPNQKMASGAFLKGYESGSYILNNFGALLRNCRVYREAGKALSSLDCNLNDPSIYFPDYLFDLVDTEYSPQGGITGEQRTSLLKTINWLKKLYKLPNTGVNTDFSVTVKRLFEQDNKGFSNLVSAGEPRSLIVMGFAVMLLASKNNNMCHRSFLKDEINFIFERLHKAPEGQRWQHWLAPVVEMLQY